MGDTSGGKEVSFEAPYKLFGIGKSLTSKDKKIIFSLDIFCETPLSEVDYASTLRRY